MCKLVVLCCPWQQPHKLLALPQLAGLRHVRVATAAVASLFWRVPTQDEGHLSTIEAIATLLGEYSAAACSTTGGEARAATAPAPTTQRCGPGAVGGQEALSRSRWGACPQSSDGGEGSPAFSPERLLFFFELIRQTIAERAAVAGVSAPPLPWESAARERRRRELVQPSRVRKRSVGRVRANFYAAGATAAGNANLTLAACGTDEAPESERLNGQRGTGG